MSYELRNLIVRILLAATIQKIRLFDKNKTKIGPNGQKVPISDQLMHPVNDISKIGPFQDTSPPNNA